jgi:uncharacterized protein YcbK (DUF882 family)
MDWTNASNQVTDHFTVGEMITLHAYNRLANESDGLNESMQNQLISLCQILEQVRDLLAVPMNVHCGFRSQGYNQDQGIKPVADVHSGAGNDSCAAIDFDCNPHLTIQEVKDKLEPVLEQLNLRMEKGTSAWIHLDTRAPGPSGRYFTP